MFGIAFVSLILSFGPCLSVSVFEKSPHLLYDVLIKESDDRIIERQEIFGIEPKNLPAQTQTSQRMAPIFAGVVSNFYSPTGVGSTTRQKLSLKGMTEEEMLYL
jgi:hypothetical protein